MNPIKSLLVVATLAALLSPRRLPTDWKSVRRSLFRVIHDLKAHGVTMLYISHRFPEVFANCDFVTVLRDGKHVKTLPMASTRESEVVSLMVGRELLAFHRQESEPSQEVMFEIRGLTKRHQYSDVSFQIRKGEIVAMAGLVGAGRSEVALGVFGCPPPDSGEVLVQNRPIRIRRAQDAMRAGIALAPEDRKSTGLVLGASVGTNVSMAVLPRLARAQFVDQRAEQNLVQRFVSRLNIRTPSHEQRVGLLSGGNQQKVMIAKWLAVEPKCLIVDEPTRGVDVGTKAEIYALFDELAHAGIPILMISSDLPEVLALADRILVMRQGPDDRRIGTCGSHRRKDHAFGCAWNRQYPCGRMKSQENPLGETYGDLALYPFLKRPVYKATHET